MDSAALELELVALDALRRLFLNGPELAWVEAVAGLDPPDGFDPVASGLRALRDAILATRNRPAGWQEALEAEYTRLLIGPGDVPAMPYGSFYLSPSRHLMTEETLAVRQCYLEAGLAVERLNQTPDDHVGVELEFLYFLGQRAAQAAMQGDQAGAAAALNARRSFVADHCGRWMPAFALRMQAATSEPVLVAAARLLAALIGRA